MIELYAITDNPGPPLPTVAPLRTVTSGSLAAICAPACKRQPSPEALWRFEHVLEALMNDRDVLPARYGTQVEDESAIERFLVRREEQLTSALIAVRGSVELSLRAVIAEEPPPASSRRASSGAEYLRTRARALEQRSQAASAVHEPLRAVAHDHARRPAKFPGEVLSVAYLVRRDRVPAFTALVAELQPRHPDLRLLCTGPWPPYSFAER